MKAICWWEISAITLSLEGSEMLLLNKPTEARTTHGAVKQGQVDLSLQEAKQLVIELQEAIKTYEDLNQGLEELNKNSTNKEDDDELGF